MAPIQLSEKGVIRLLTDVIRYGIWGKERPPRSPLGFLFDKVVVGMDLFLGFP